MRRTCSSRLLGMLMILSVGSLLVLSGCGGSSSSASGPVTEEGGRFKSLQKLGSQNSKEIIAAKKKQALQERAKK